MRITAPINIEVELQREQRKQKAWLDSVHDLLNDASEQDATLLNRLKGDNSAPTSADVLRMQPERVYTLEAIRNTCIRYRLRFLDSRYFKSPYPYEAIAQIKEFEKTYQCTITSFKIIAPDHLFDLENIHKDPLLFAELSDGNYFLLHRWGNDLQAWRRWLVWPIQNFKTFFFSLMAVCFLTSFLIPSSILHVFNLESEIYLRLWFTVHLFLGLSGISLWLAFSYDKRFSDMQWNSKYFNY